MTRGPRPAWALALPAIAGAMLMLAQQASAQQDNTKALERAQKAADAVFHWIKLNGEKGANRQQQETQPGKSSKTGKPGGAHRMFLVVRI